MYDSKFPVCVLMASCTGTLSTTDHSTPPSRTTDCLFFISSMLHTSPLGIWWSAVTTPEQPAWRMSDNRTGSLGPNQRMVCCILYGSCSLMKLCSEKFQQNEW